MIAGGVGFIMNLLNLSAFLMQFRIIHFLILIGCAIAAKYIYSFLKPEIKDPMTSHPLAKKFFFLGMGILAASLVMRNYNIPYYNILLYLDIAIQLIALGISFSSKLPTNQELNEDILDV